jgi:hypothetical protein
VDQQRVDNDGRQLFPCNDDNSLLRFCRPKRVYQFFEQRQMVNNNHYNDIKDNQQRQRILNRLQQGEGMPLSPLS